MPAFLLPDLGEGLTEAEIVTWRVQTGDTVTVDQPIVEVETAKAVVEVPVPFAGRVTALHGQPGDVVAVGAPLVTVDTESGNVLVGYGTSSGHRRRHRPARSPAASNGRVPVASPLIRQLARNASLDLETVRGSGRGGLITRHDFGTSPPHVEYRLTELGGSLMVVIDTMREWSERYLGDLLAHREQKQEHET